MAIPVYQSSYVNGSNAFEIVLSYDAQLDPTSTPDPSDFVVSGGRAVTSVEITSIAYPQSWIMLHVNNTEQSGWVNFGESVTVSYTAGTNPLKNADGNCANLVNEPITNNVKDPAPIVEYASVNSLNPRLWTLILNRPCETNLAAFTLKINGVATTGNTLTNFNTGTYFIEVNEPVAFGDVLTLDMDTGQGYCTAVQKMYPIEGTPSMVSFTGRHVVNGLPNPTPDHIFELNEIWNPDVSYVQAGDTVAVRGGQRGNTHFGFDFGWHGTIDNPVIVTTIGGVAYCGDNPSSSEALEFENCSHFIVAGGTPEEPYGFQCTAYFAIQAQYCTNFEIFGAKILNAGAIGIVARTNVGCDGNWSKFNWVQENTNIHDNHVVEAIGEGFYVGASHWGSGQEFQPGCEGEKLIEHELKGFTRVYNNQVYNCGWDGIQVGSAVENCEIFNNVIDNYAYERDPSDMAGLQINAGTQGLVYRNTITRGVRDDFSYGIFHGGSGYNTFFENIITDVYCPVLLSDNGVPIVGAWTRFHNNTVDNAENNLIEIFCTILQCDLQNNILTRHGGSGDFIQSRSGGTWTESANLKTQVIDDVKFVDYLNGNYALQSDSPAIGAANDISNEGVYLLDQGALQYSTQPTDEIIIGHDSIYPSEAVANTLRAQAAVVTSNMVMENIGIYHNGFVTAGYVAIFEDDNGSPSNRIKTSISFQADAQEGWQDIPLPLPLMFNEEELVWIAIVVESSDFKVRYTTGDGSTQRALGTTTYVTGIPTVFGTHSLSDTNYSFRASGAIGHYALPTHEGVTFNQADLSVWRNRAISGPYKTHGDRFTNSPGAWDDVILRADDFFNDDVDEFWDGDMVNDSDYTYNKGHYILAAAFIYLINGDEGYGNAVKNAVLLQVRNANPVFENYITRPTGGWNNTFHFGNFCLRLFNAFEYTLPLFSSSEILEVETYLDRGSDVFYEAGIYLAEYNFPNRSIGDYTVLAGNALSEEKSYGITHPNGKTHLDSLGVRQNELYDVHIDYPNTGASFNLAFGLIAIYFNDTYRINQAKIYYEEWFKYTVFPDGTMGENYRNGEYTRAATGAMEYSPICIESALLYAEALIKIGDYSLIFFSSTDGILGTEGGIKNFNVVALALAENCNGSVLRYYDGVDDANKLDLYDEATNYRYKAEMTLGICNKYLRSQAFKDIYMLQDAGVPPLDPSYHIPSSAPSDGIWIGNTSILPAVPFMYYERENFNQTARKQGARALLF